MSENHELALKQASTLHAIALGVLALIVASLSYMVMGLGMASIYTENSWVENAQVAILCIACAIFFIDAQGLSGRHKTLCYFFSMLCFAFMFREVDFDRIDGMPDFIVFMLAGKGRTFFFIILLALLALMLRDIKIYWASLTQYLRCSVVVYIGIAALMLIIFSTAFDKKLIVIEHRIFFEELSEMTAYYFILLASLFAKPALRVIQ